MNKQEYENDIHELSRTIEYLCKWKEQIQQQLTEAEKPKLEHLEHGDFGIEHKEFPTILISEGDSHLKAIRKDFTLKAYNNPDLHCYTIYGNIFKLMEEWGKDFSRYEAVVMDSADGCDKVIIQPSSRSKDKIFIGSILRGQKQLGIHLSKSELQDFWMALGTASFNLRKQLTSK